VVSSPCNNCKIYNNCVGSISCDEFNAWKYDINRKPKVSLKAAVKKELIALANDAANIDKIDVYITPYLERIMKLIKEAK
jgi:hypothetical protein